VARSFTPSQFAIAHFGAHAADVTRCVVDGLVRGQRAARNVQAAADREGASTRRPYGSMWDSRYMHMVEQFRLNEIPGCVEYRPKGASYKLAVINGRVLIPFRHATKLGISISPARIRNRIPLTEARRLGVEPSPTLFDALVDEPEPTVAEAAATAHAAEDLTVIYVAYVANAGSDTVLEAWWGQPTALEDNGTLTWFPERLDLGIATPHLDTPALTGLAAPATPVSTPAFAHGAEPSLNVRSRSEQAASPSAEAEPETPDAQHGEQ
jgi:hypothetical protein